VIEDRYVRMAQIVHGPTFTGPRAYEAGVRIEAALHRAIQRMIVAARREAAPLLWEGDDS
jgi:hypothetical protein